MSAYLDVAIDAAKKGGATLLKFYNGEFSIKRKADHSPVTEADIASEKTIIETIRKRYPGHAFLAEEGGAQGTSDFLWIIDPLDGTFMFTHSIPGWAVLVALQHKGEIILGVSYDPVNDHLLWAERGKGVYLQGPPGGLSKTEEPTNALCVIEHIGGFVAEGLSNNLLSIIRGTHVGGMDARNGYRLLFAGKIDAMLGAGLRIWDCAAYAVIVEELGGKVTDCHGKPLSLGTTSFLATNPKLHPKLLELLKVN